MHFCCRRDLRTFPAVFFKIEKRNLQTFSLLECMVSCDRYSCQNAGMHRPRFINSRVSNPVLTMGALAHANAAMQFFKESVKTSNSLEQLR